MMYFYILNRSLEKVAIIDNFVSAIWNRKYNEVGDFELYFPISEGITDIIQNDYFVQKEDDDAVMIIKSIKITTDVENGDYITISGVSAEDILNQRIMLKRTTVNGRVEDICNQLILENIIAPADDVRKIPNFVLSPYKGFSDWHDGQYNGDNLLTVISQICKKFNLGFKISLIDESFIFSLYRGIDRSYNQAANPWVVFSADFDNLLETDYSLKSENYKNVAIVGGKDDGIYQPSVSTGSGSGLDRYEVFVDGSKISSDDLDESVSYSELLRTKGNEVLTDQQMIKALESSVDTEGHQFGTDYNLGDIVQISTKYGISATARVTAITENEDESGFKIYPTFDVWEVK